MKRENYDWLCMTEQCDDSVIYDQRCRCGYYLVLCYKQTEKYTYATSKPVSSKQLGDIVIQDSRTYFIEEMGGMWRHEYSDQTDNKMCLLLPNKWPVSYRNHPHSTLYLSVLCWSNAIFLYHWNFWLFWASFLHIFYGPESMLKYR